MQNQQYNNPTGDSSVSCSRRFCRRFQNNKKICQDIAGMQTDTAPAVLVRGKEEAAMDIFMQKNIKQVLLIIV